MEHAVAGVFAGITGTLIGYPMEVVKTRLQASRGIGALGTLTAIVRERGVAGLYRGVALPLAALTFLNAQTFALYAGISARLRELPSMSKDLVPFCAGVSCAPFASIVTTPLELLKVRVALGAPSILAAFRGAKRRELYLGHGVNTAREGLFLGVYFATYDCLRAKEPGAPKWRIPLAGALAGAAGWIISYPLDCVKANVQKVRSGKSTFVVAMDLMRANGGVLALYRGVGPSVWRACLVSSVRFSVYELVLSAFTKEQGKAR